MRVSSWYTAGLLLVLLSGCRTETKAVCYEVRVVKQEKGYQMLQRKAVECPAGWSW